ncbi:MAG: Ig-like domain-containing protein, partial [Thermoanaerobaculia bacterium]
MQANVPGWIDAAIGKSKPEAKGLYKTWPDTLDETNVVYGTRQSSGMPSGTNPRIGTFSTLADRTFSGEGRFEYFGRLLRTNADTRIGLSFFSFYPEEDRYYLVGLWSQPGTSRLTMQLFTFGGGALVGTLDSNVTLEPDRWYRFRIQADAVDGETRVRARFWPDGDPEPQAFQIEATDSSASRLTSGRIGIWSAVKGDAYVDDLHAKSPVDHTPPAIAFFESNDPIEEGEGFNRDIVPEIRITDDLSTFTFTATLDGQPYSAGTPVVTEAFHTVEVAAEDQPGNRSSASVTFFVDKTAPIVEILESGEPLAPGTWFNRDVLPSLRVTDLSPTDAELRIGGVALPQGTAVSAEGAYQLTASATDTVGWTTQVGPVEFTIDKTAPSLAVTNFTAGEVIASPRVRVGGAADDAVAVTVNGAPAPIDSAARTYLSSELALLESENEISIGGVDRAGNETTLQLVLVLDTRAPEVVIASPADGACLDTDSVAISGSFSDPHLDAIRVRSGEAVAEAAVDSAARSWAASIELPEGRQTLVVEAGDTVGHRAISTLAVAIDRTAPSIEILADAAPLGEGPPLNRSFAPTVTVRDLDPAPAIELTLDGVPWANGSLIEAEGAHTLTAVATDCAGHRAERTVAFMMDRTPPVFGDFTPPRDARIGEIPASIAGSVSADTESVAVAGTAVAVVPANGSFTLAGLSFFEGENRLLLRATDHAGNTAETDYRFTIETTAPSIEILDSGAPIADGALYARVLRPEIRLSNPAASVTATLNGAPFSSGTLVSTDGAYTLAVSATDDLGHTASREVAFTIDTTAPTVAIAAPQPGLVTGDSVVVQGTAGESVSVTVNGVAAALASGQFNATVPIDEGDNVLVALGRDAAGNTGRAEVVVTRDSRPTGVLITAPADGYLTNRPSVRVTGRVLDPSAITGVTIGATTVAVDAAGRFDLGSFPLSEGENAIIATATSKSGGTTSAAVLVIADRTPPSLRILESGQVLSDQARFAESAFLAVDATDERELLSAEARIDGNVVALPLTFAAAGGHTIAAVAVDAAGNETRLQRTFFIGSTSAAATCALDAFDPPSGSVIAAAVTGLTGRTGGAAGVKVGGIPATVANGSFCATVELPLEGENAIEVVCTDADGNPIGEPKTVVLIRATTLPAVSIAAPEEGLATASETIAVSGTAGPGVVEVTVNGLAASIEAGDPNAARPFSLDGVRLAPGLNVLLVRGRTATGRPALASRRVLYLKDAPSTAITSPLPGQALGSSAIAVSGTFSGLDASTLSVGGSVATAEVSLSGERSGSFLFREVLLNQGDNILTVTGRDALGRLASATATIARDDALPSIAIESPRDHAVFGSNAATAVEVTGTAVAANGATIEVGGHPATIVAAEPLSETRTRYTFTASVGFATAGPTPVVARVSEPAGNGSHHAIRIAKLAAAPEVRQIFPDESAIGVDPGAMVVVLFSNPMDRESLRCGAGEGCAFRLESPSGSAVSGVLEVDREALTFAPAAPLEDGAEYTIRITTAAKDAGGVPLGSEWISRFRIGLAAPATAPVLDALPAKHCGSTLAVTGSAPPSARVRLDVGPLVLTTTADASGRFRFDAPLTGRAGYHLVRVRTLGADGGLSAAAYSCVLVDCGGLAVSSATFDRTTNVLTIAFTADVDLASATSDSVRIRISDGSYTSATIALATPSTLHVTPSIDLTRASFTLEVTTAVRRIDGAPLNAPFAQPFLFDSGEPAPGDGTGFVSGEVYDASTGRPLVGASVTLSTPVNAFGMSASSNATPMVLSDTRGRYTLRLAEGVHTLEVTAEGFTTVWRQIIVAAGSGVTPIDIRLARRADQAAATAPVRLTDGGVALDIPGGGIGAGVEIAITSVGAQSLAGLLPL